MRPDGRAHEELALVAREDDGALGPVDALGEVRNRASQVQPPALQVNMQDAAAEGWRPPCRRGRWQLAGLVGAVGLDEPCRGVLETEVLYLRRQDAQRRLGGRRHHGQVGLVVGRDDHEARQHLRHWRRHKAHGAGGLRQLHERMRRRQEATVSPHENIHPYHGVLRRSAWTLVQAAVRVDPEGEVCAARPVHASLVASVRGFRRGPAPLRQQAGLLAIPTRQVQLERLCAGLVKVQPRLQFPLCLLALPRGGRRLARDPREAGLLHDDLIVLPRVDVPPHRYIDQRTGPGAVPAGLCGRGQRLQLTHRALLLGVPELHALVVRTALGESEAVALQVPDVLDTIERAMQCGTVLLVDGALGRQALCAQS
mmetsp:Transcript_31484/g.92151  ORF Transcript_31484/g.92151 Transcript_31484/m.92151 type:complete len:369 (-) Transcript_31484:2074-3180(-)